jgi:hypothetical protein
VTTNFDGGCLLHVPYKNWSSPEEEANYNDLERWSLRLLDCVPPAAPSTPATSGHYSAYQGDVVAYAGNSSTRVDHSALTLTMGTQDVLVPNPSGPRWGVLEMTVPGFLIWVLDAEVRSGWPGTGNFGMQCYSGTAASQDHWQSRFFHSTASPSFSLGGGYYFAAPDFFNVDLMNDASQGEMGVFVQFTYSFVPS